MVLIIKFQHFMSHDVVLLMFWYIAVTEAEITIPYHCFSSLRMAALMILPEVFPYSQYLLLVDQLPYHTDIYSCLVCLLGRYPPRVISLVILQFSWTISAASVWSFIGHTSLSGVSARPMATPCHRPWYPTVQLDNKCCFTVIIHRTYTLVWCVC